MDFGGQTPLKLALPLERAGVPIVGTSPDSIDLAEHRERFSELIKRLGIKQPDNGIAAHLNAGVVPALYLTAPTKREIQPVGFGLMALNELIERVAALGSKPRPEL